MKIEKQFHFKQEKRTQILCWICKSVFCIEHDGRSNIL